MLMSHSKEHTPDEIKDFFLSIEIEDATAVKSYLDEGLSPNTVSESGRTALQAALFDGSVDIAIMLIDQGADCSGPGVLGGSLVHDASWSVLLVRRLIEGGADPFAIDNAGYDTVFSAANNLSMKTLELLAAAGCRMDRVFPHDNGKMAIHAAAHHHDEDVVATFVKLGVPATSLDNDLNTVILSSVKSNYISALSDGDRTPFIKAMQGMGVDIDAKDALGRTALHYAAMMPNPALVSCLVARGARADVLDHQNLTALDVANEFTLPILESLRAKTLVDELLTKSIVSRPHP